MLSNFRQKIRDILENHSKGVDFDINYPNRDFGDYSTNIAFIVAEKERSDPMKIAGELVSDLEKDKNCDKLFSEIKVAKPGFINFKMSQEALKEVMSDVLRKGAHAFGKNNLGKGKINIEFVSANPTGPLTLGNGRSAAYGDTLARVLEYSGYKVTREYYINDIGTQVNTLGESVARSYLSLKGKNIDFPENMYQGEYIKEIARQFERDSIYSGSDDDFESLCSSASQYALKKILGQVKSVLHQFGLDYDVWFSEREELHDKGKILNVIDELRKKDLLYEKDGATWFKSTDFGLDSDFVVRKSIGQKATSYIMSDFAYAKDKIERGFNKCIIVLGADHHGDVPRIKAAIEALGLGKENFNIIVHQLVNLKKGQEKVRMSKRKGEFITLRELMEEISVDVIRFFYLMKSLDSHIDFDLNLAKEESSNNPVYYTQYAHARVSSLLRKIKEVGEDFNQKESYKLLEDNDMTRLALLVARLPEVIEDTVKDYQVHRLTRYAHDLASAIQFFYDENRVLKRDFSGFEDKGKNKLSLLVAAQDVLREVLNLLGVRAPDKM